MARREIKKMGAVLIAAGLSIAMCSPSVSANVRTGACRGIRRPRGSCY